ncbi:MAG: hypothetical protein DRP66_05110 [Planctomycetota bacterium]|nr:MAG: hypothetical protein DRP66_05110 [Planctomycetota bacterium]
MNENYPTGPIVDETDCLGAAGAFKSFKNLAFLISLVCLILLQAAFWMNYLDLIDTSDCSCPEPTGVPTEVAAEASAVEQAGALAMEAAAAASESSASGNQAGIFGFSAIGLSAAGPTCRQMFCIIAICNCVLFVAVVLFSLTLLMSLKISIVGRLGGINHIARAFLLSLFLLVLIVPWQVCLPGTVVGAIYTADELLCADPVPCDGPFADCIFYFGRFTGLWAVVTILLIAAQVRSVRWSKAVIRKLQILK